MPDFYRSKHRSAFGDRLKGPNRSGIRVADWNDCQANEESGKSAMPWLQLKSTGCGMSRHLYTGHIMSQMNPGLCLVSRVVSMGRRNTFLQFTRRSLKT